MRQIMENLRALQNLQLHTQPLSLQNERAILELRAPVPAAILARFDRLIARRKKGVAIARNGACGECHLRLPSGTMAALAYTNEIHVCDNCGRYLYLPENEPLGLNDPPPNSPAKSRERRTRQRTELHAV